MKAINVTGKKTGMEIYQAALDLFSEKGYEGTSMSMIAKVVGISKANLYYYCSSKENLLYRIYLHDLQENFIPILNEAEKLRDPKERLSYFLRQTALLNTLNPTSRILVHEIRNLDRTHYNEIRSIWKRAYALVSQSVKDLKKSERVRELRESFLTFLSLGMVLWIPYWFDYSRQENAGELADTLVQVLLNGMLYPPNKKKLSDVEKAIAKAETEELW